MARALAAIGPRRGGAGEGGGHWRHPHGRAPNPLVDLEYARLLADAGKVAEAREKLAELTAQFGDRPEINRTLAFLDLAGGDLDGCRPALRCARRQRARTASSPSITARRSRPQRGDPEAARRFYGRISSGPYLVPGAARDCREPGPCRRRASRPLEQLTRFGQDHPAQAFEVLEYQAQILQLLQRPDDALAVYGEALQYKPAAVSVLLARGALLEQQGRIREALADLADCRGAGPGRSAGRCECLRLPPGQSHRTGPQGLALRPAGLRDPAAQRRHPGQRGLDPVQAWPRRGGPQPSRRGPATGCRIPRSPVIWPRCSGNWATGTQRPSCCGRPPSAFPDSKPVRDTAERLLD